MFLTKPVNKLAKSPNIRIIYLDILKIFSAFAVIMIHIFAPALNFYTNRLSDLEVAICEIIRYFFSWSVPCFVMITGALLLNQEKELSYKKLFTRYIPRIIYALLVFGIPYAWLEILYDEKIFAIEQIGQVFMNILTGNLWDHMWYLYMLIGLYLILPIIKLFVKMADEKSLSISIVVLFIFNSIVPWFQHRTNIAIGIQFPISSIYIFYLLCGYLFSKKDIRNIILPLILIIIPLIIDILIAFDIIRWLDYSNDFNYSSPLIVCMSIGFFLLVKQYKKQIPIVENLSRLCFCIYLIHPLFINIMYKLLRFNPNYYPVGIIMPILMITVTSLSLVCSYILYKIHFLRKYVL